MSSATVHTAVSSIPCSSDDIQGHNHSQLTQSCQKFVAKETHAKWPLFSKWRPSFHFIASEGWMNDPCAPCYDPVAGVYHLFYQWNPRHHEWGNISWGHAVSKDLITWKHVADTPALQPDTEYDCEGVFTGCMAPVGSDDTMTIFYTSVSYTPINYTLPYIRGCETLSVATSTDRGVTWIKSKKNPIVAGPPLDIEPTAWRDPFVDSWPQMDSLLGRKTGSYVYGVIAGGIRNQTPTCFLYSYKQNDPTSWEYLGSLANIGHNYCSSRWSGDFGVSWEVCNFFSLQDTQFMVVNAEGCDLTKRYLKETLPARPVHQALWMTFELSISNQGEPKMTPSYSGILDHGCYYAAMTFFDPVGYQRILWGWLPEDDTTSEQRALQGWVGCLALPRELFELAIPHVVRPMVSNMKDLTNCSTIKDEAGMFTVSTLGIRPLKDLTKLRQDSSYRGIPDICFASSSSARHQLDITSRSWEIQVDIQITDLTEEVGLSICHNKDYTQEVVIRFSPGSERLTVDRLKSTSVANINTSPDSGSHTLFYIRNPKDEVVKLETLKLQIFCDNSVLEIFANDRFALTSRIYPDISSVNVSLFATPKQNARLKDDDVIARFTTIQIWENLLNISKDL
ncbi:hypothetical protein NQZ79_g6252 [Umbelopsis isabellina]|nr:hypothetical protein NQZ79_g6252 [Umbelopsis isabellina]